MKINEVTPELARKMGNAYLESFLVMGVEISTPQQNAVWNGLHALEYLESARADLKRECLDFATYALTNRVEELEDMLAESEQELSAYLNNFKM